mmetsp:Transcript_9612/g.27627  ORF Transcript_9612/g.27627 Transcript_9612/m.27627 type:complete len:572 (+) Transcript_9612:961-2676(+)
MYRMALGLEPTHVGALCNLGNMVLLRHNDTEEAAFLYAKALEIAPTDADLHGNKGLVHYYTAVQRHGNVTEESFEETRVVCEREYSAAEASFRKSLELNPDLSESLCNLGLLMAQVHYNDQEAFVLLRRAATVSPAAPEPLCNLALLHASNGQLRAAEDLLLRAMRVRPTHPPAERLLRFVRRLIERQRQQQLVQQTGPGGPSGPGVRPPSYPVGPGGVGTAWNASSLAGPVPSYVPMYARYGTNGPGVAVPALGRPPLSPYSQAPSGFPAQSPTAVSSPVQPTSSPMASGAGRPPVVGLGPGVPVLDGASTASQTASVPMPADEELLPLMTEDPRALMEPEPGELVRREEEDPGPYRRRVTDQARIQGRWWDVREEMQKAVKEVAQETGRTPDEVLQGMLPRPTLVQQALTSIGVERPFALPPSASQPPPALPAPAPRPQPNSPGRPADPARPEAAIEKPKSADPQLQVQLASATQSAAPSAPKSPVSVGADLRPGGNAPNSPSKPGTVPTRGAGAPAAAAPSVVTMAVANETAGLPSSPAGPARRGRGGRPPSKARGTTGNLDTPGLTK